jgi:hypothetical protein
MNHWSVFDKHRAEQPRRAHVLTRPSDGVRVTVNSLGRAVDATGSSPTWNHPWRPFLAGNSVTFTLGSVQSFAGTGTLEPVIDSNGQKLPMSGEDGTAPTPLALDAVVANDDGVSWAVLEVHPDDNGELQQTSPVQIIHTNTPISHVLAYGRCPIAQILWSNGQPIQALAMVHFNLRYLRVLPSSNSAGSPRHMFL